MTTIPTILEDAFAASLTDTDSMSTLSPPQVEWVQTIAQQAASQKGVFTVLVTSLGKKILSPEQDVRLHQDQIPGGYSGRTLDTKFVTPFIREKFSRLAMSESGWLTRSLEQPHPYTLGYEGRIKNKTVKNAFLYILNDIEENNADARIYLIALFSQVSLLHSTNLIFDTITLYSGVTIAKIIEALQQHFFTRYPVSGASRLPVLAIYAIYKCLLSTPRYEGKQLAPLKSHTTSDIRSGSVADVEILNLDSTFFEAVEVKHNIAITPDLIQIALNKIQTSGIARFYLLTTREPNSDHPEQIQEIVDKIHKDFGIEIIMNGIVPSLKYYLRLLDDPSIFLGEYREILQADFALTTDIKLEHLQRWIDLTQKFTPDVG